VQLIKLNYRRLQDSRSLGKEENFVNTKSMNVMRGVNNWPQAQKHM
jgi:hypothetical protein